MIVSSLLSQFEIVQSSSKGELSLNMRTSLMFLLFCTAGASLLLVFFYSQNLTGSWQPPIHFFQEIDSASKLMTKFLHFRNNEDQQRQKRKKEALKTEEKPKMFGNGQKAKDTLSKESDNERNGKQKTNEPLPMRKNLIILSPARGGSTFLGSFFNNNPQVMYCYEPLYPVQKMFNVHPSHQEPKKYKETSIKVIDGFFQCDFSNVTKAFFPAFTRSEFHRKQSKTLTKKYLPQFSNAPLSESCNSYNHTVVKILSSRLPNKTMQTLEELFQQKNGYDVRLVHLVRDPRAIIYSTVKLGWVTNGFQSPWFSGYAHTVCDRILKNVRLGLLSPPPWLKNRFKVIRYEDLALHTLNVTQELYKFAGFDWSASVDEWISTLGTNAKMGGPYSLYRNASISIGRWKNAPEPFIRAVENNCGDLMNFIGYEKWRKPDV